MHTSQADWAPDTTSALFVVVLLDEWPEKVTFEGKHYISLIDGNVYSQASYPVGWQEQA